MSIKVGLAGAGAIARAHLRAYVRHQQVEAVQVADPCAEARDRLAAEYGILRHSCADLAELLADESLELIDLCTPPELHCEQALAALRAGKHVIVETPLALTVQDCDEMIQVAAETGRHLFCALNHRWFPAHRRAEEALAAGEIGRPLLGMVAVLGDQRPLAADAPDWRDSWQQAAGTTLLESGYHAVYMLQRFFGPTSAVTVTTGKLSQLGQETEAGAGADDTCLVALEMESGALCNVVVTYTAAGDRWSEERRLIGSEGSLLIRDNPEDEMPLLAFHQDEFRPLKVINPPEISSWATREAVMSFVDCVLHDKDSDVTLQEARSAVATITAAYDSARDRRRVEVVA